MLNRRTFSERVVFVPLVASSLALKACAMAPLERERAEPGEIDRWMNSYATLPSKGPSGPIIGQRFPEKFHIITEAFSWTDDPPYLDGSPFPRVDIPKNFVTDFASVPRVFWSLFPAEGKYAAAALVHDFLYWEQRPSPPNDPRSPRQIADQTFKRAMTLDGVNAPTRFSLFQAVDLFGEAAWEENRKRKAAGEKRVLRVVPPRTSDGARITWDEWRKRDVF